jgi:diacylglycerol kinase
MNFARFLRSFAIGAAGFLHALRSEQNMRIHCVIAAAVIAAGFFFQVAAWEWVALVFAIGLVLSAECLNTALERLADRVSPEKHPLLGQAKDCGSAAVLVLAATAAVVGGVIFGPKLWALLAG